MIPTFLDRRGEVPRHVCAQCGGPPDGKEEPVRHGDALVWLHPECRRFWLREPGNYADARVAKPEQTKQIARPLHVLLPLIKEKLKKADEAARAAGLPYYLAVGQLLLEAKAQLDHGEFMQWVKRNLNVKHRQATNYMAYAKQQSGTECQFERVDTLSQFLRETRNPNYNNPASIDDNRAAYIRNLQAENQAESLRREQLKRVCLEIISTGYKTLAAKMHPDKSGSEEAMAWLNRARDHLKNFA